MKKLVTSLMLMFAVLANAAVFVNKNGTFVLFNDSTDIVKGFTPSDNCPKGSFNYYRSCLGYEDGEVIFHFSDGTYNFGLNLFNNEVIFVMTRDTSKTTLTQQEISNSLACDIPDANDFLIALQRGINNIRLTFVEKSLGVTAINNILTDDIHGYTYTFENDVLINYKNNNGLSEDAIFVKEYLSQIFNKILINARDHYGTSSKFYTEYINGQCKYLLRIDTNYLRQAYSTNINYNFALLYCILYEGMGLDEFSLLVPNAEISSSVHNYVIMSYGTYIFTFKDNVHIKK